MYYIHNFCWNLFLVQPWSGEKTPAVVESFHSEEKAALSHRENDLFTRRNERDRETQGGERLPHRPRRRQIPKEIRSNPSDGGALPWLLIYAHRCSETLYLLELKTSQVSGSSRCAYTEEPKVVRTPSLVQDHIYQTHDAPFNLIQCLESSFSIS